MEKWYQNWTWLGYLNFFILQWFFIRLAKEIKINDDNYFNSEDDKEESFYKNKINYKILKWIVPLTGWWSDYIWLKKKIKTDSNISKMFGYYADKNITYHENLGKVKKAKHIKIKKNKNFLKENFF